MKNIEWINFGYLKIQVDKLVANKGRHFNVVYINDSSGGYALATKNDSTSINLCLTGPFCNNGLLSFIDLVDYYISYDTIFVISALDIASREVSEGVYWLPFLADHVVKKSVAYFYSIQYARGIMLNTLMKNYFPVPKSSYIDYPITEKKIESTSNVFQNRIEVKQLIALKTLNDKLRSTSKKFYILFGPSLPYDRAYFQELCEILPKYQIQHALNLPFLLNNNTRGDSPDHVHPSDRDSTTTQYYRHLILSSSF